MKKEGLINLLHESVVENSPPDAVSFTLFINEEGYEVTYRTHSPEYLKREGITMKNLKGDWIK